MGTYVATVAGSKDVEIVSWKANRMIPIIPGAVRRTSARGNVIITNPQPHEVYDHEVLDAEDVWTGKDWVKLNQRARVMLVNANRGLNARTA